MGKSERNDIEHYFEWWLDDCVAAGYVDSWDRESEEYKLFPEYRMKRMKYYKSKAPDSEVFNLLQADRYTYDYRVVWNDKAKFIFFNPSDFTDRDVPQMLYYRDTFFHAFESVAFGKFVSFVDVKPPAKAARFSGSLTSFATFPIKQKILLWNYGIYINKVVPIPMSGSGVNTSLFPNTFTPKRYFMTDGGNMSRKIKYHIETLDSYVQKRKTFLGQMDAMVRNAEDRKSVV